MWVFPAVAVILAAISIALDTRVDRLSAVTAAAIAVAIAVPTLLRKSKVLSWVIWAASVSFVWAAVSALLDGQWSLAALAAAALCCSTWVWWDNR